MADKNWGWFGNRSSGEGLEFTAAAIPWTDQAWLRGGQYIMAAEIGGGPTFKPVWALNSNSFIQGGGTVQ